MRTTEIDEDDIKLGLIGDEKEQEEALNRAFERYRKPIVAFIRSLTPGLDSAFVATATHDVFRGLANYAREGRYDPDGPLARLLFTIARRKAYEQLRKQTRQKRRDDEFFAEVAERLKQSGDIGICWKNAADLGIARDLMRQFRIWLVTLPPLQRKVAQVIHNNFGDVTDAEICDEIAKTDTRPTVASVKSARHEICAKFKTMIAGKEKAARYESQTGRKSN